MLVKTISFYDFVEEFEKHGRENQFSYAGKKALYDYLNEVSEDIREPIELDVIGLCCEYTEYDNLEEFNDNYGYDIESLEDLEYYTTVIRINEDSFIIQDF